MSTPVAAKPDVKAMLMDLADTWIPKRTPKGKGDCAVGVVGLGVMGKQLCMNLSEKLEKPIAGFDLDPEKAAATAELSKTEVKVPVQVFSEVAGFVGALQRPRVVLLFVPAGRPVDSAIGSLSKYMAKGDVLVDCGNEFFEHTERRQKQLSAKGIIFMGMGTSGGERGARRGPCMMPGGPEAGWKILQPIVEAICAKVESEVEGAAADKCVCYIGPGGSGHYVKMVHNGIEYGDMQLIAEAAHFCRKVGKLGPLQLADLLDRYNSGPLSSFLVEITATLYRKEDDQKKAREQKPASEAVAAPALVDALLDSAGSKGTGKWTIQQAAELGVPCATMAAALEARYVSALKPQRMRAAAQEGEQACPEASAAELEGWESDLESALLGSKLCSYAQGMALLAAASDAHSWGLELERLAVIWQGGCIIRAQVLTLVRNAYRQDPALPNLLLDPSVAAELQQRSAGWRRTVQLAVAQGVPVPALSASLAYYDTFRADTLHSAQCVQAQRDCFGGHGFKRLDLPGTFHAEWLPKEEVAPLPAPPASEEAAELPAEVAAVEAAVEEAAAPAEATAMQAEAALAEVAPAAEVVAAAEAPDLIAEAAAVAVAQAPVDAAEKEAAPAVDAPASEESI